MCYSFNMSKSVTQNAVWCVQHSEGWCAVQKNIIPLESANNVPTRCGGFIILPFGFQKQVPTCPDCLAKMNLKSRQPKKFIQAEQNSFSDLCHAAIMFDL